MNERKRACFGTKIKQRYITITVVVIIMKNDKKNEKSFLFYFYRHFLPCDRWSIQKL